MSGFADLRMNQAADQGGDSSFWPSFTDIMAVVVMIFLLTTSVLIVRNWELIKRIRETVAAEQAAQELAASQSVEMETVEEQLEAAQQRIAKLRVELFRLEQERRLSEERITSQAQAIQQARTSQAQLESALADESQSKASLAEKLDNLVRQYALLQAEFESLRGQLSTTQANVETGAARYAALQGLAEQTAAELAVEREAVATLRTESGELRTALVQQQEQSVSLESEAAARIAALEQQRQRAAALEAELAANIAALESQRRQYDDLLSQERATRASMTALQSQEQQARDSLSTLQGEYETQSQHVTTLEDTVVEVEARFASLVGEYGDLKVKYNKLIKPARSARGRYVVEVRYLKREGEELLSMREPDDADERQVSLTQLHQRLTELRDRYPDLLYIRVIFPEQSGLSYAEAWELTQDLLSKYDYYHRN